MFVRVVKVRWIRLLVVALVLATPLTADRDRTARGGRPLSAGVHPSALPGAGPGATSPPDAPSTPAGVYAGRLPRFDKAPPAVRPAAVAEDGGLPWVSRVPTGQRVAFITIDDGWVKHPQAAELLREARVPVTLFLTINAISDNPGYFRTLQDIGAVIEAHTITHTKLPGLSYDAQRQEVCGSADRLGELYGRRPTLFRPPFGEKDATTLRAARDCGLKAAFSWKESVNQGNVWYQEVKVVQPGDVILMHFRDQFVEDFIAALRGIEAAGLTPAQLEDYYS
ncbi:polysaccharide deacetylase family protein [Dactylosporangium sp. AC04546]|uniref:polysaccharide deacetylase family protein n=1 Tax=Dactylosporangium sp. AC04546 TaxID=2862460 RepID=UPI001EDE4B08|nr:polysaccharide deacetylase family protein [Dactylosporangium sp. AC04546]WVK79678.1 polysaccharide deacetylase family protein [Dactylosporangium sp. AC04546]